MHLDLPEKRYYSIGELAKAFDVNASLIRFWDKEFDILKPKKNAKGNRMFTPEDVKNLQLIYHLVKERGFTLEGAKIHLKEGQKKTLDKFEIIRNKALPHNTFRIYGKSVDDITCSLELNAPQIIKIIHDAEIQKIQEDNSKSLLNPTILKNKFHIDLQIPTGYEYMLHKRNFIWLKKDIISGNTSLLIYQIPIRSFEKSSNVVDNIIRMRDSVGYYIKGKEPKTRMITGEAYAPYFSTILLDGKKAFETKGTWELKNDFMAGPFINYAIVDEMYNRILVIEGFCYSPSNQERDLMLDLEAIIKSVKIDKR